MQHLRFLVPSSSVTVRFDESRKKEVVDFVLSTLFFLSFINTS